VDTRAADDVVARAWQAEADKRARVLTALEAVRRQPARSHDPAHEHGQVGTRVGTITSTDSVGLHGMDATGAEDSERLAIILPDGASVAPGWLPFPACRMRLSRRELDRPLGKQTTANRAALSRWARFVSDRTLGLALGGGGAWGYGHVALIQEICKRGVPIDGVAGVSFGALVGAYYCAAGLDGLRLLIDKGDALQRMVPMAVFSSRIIGYRATQDLGDLWLDDLDTIFLPVACDISRAETVAIRGPRWRWVRALRARFRRSFHRPRGWTRWRAFVAGMWTAESSTMCRRLP